MDSREEELIPKYMNRIVKKRKIEENNNEENVKKSCSSITRVSIRNNSFTFDSELIRHISPLKFTFKRSSSPKYTKITRPKIIKNNKDTPEQDYSQFVQDFFNDIPEEVQMCMIEDSDPQIDLIKDLKKKYASYRNPSIQESDSDTDTDIDFNPVTLLQIISTQSSQCLGSEDEQCKRSLSDQNDASEDSERSFVNSSSWFTGNTYVNKIKGYLHSLLRHGEDNL